MTNFADMTPEQQTTEVVADTNRIMAAAVGIYPGMEVRHVKSGGDYIVVCEATIEATMLPAVVYRSEKDGSVWVRPRGEFCDGRFVGR